MSQKVNVTTPVGRLVMGDLYTPNDKDAEGKPLVVKSGANAGQPRVQYFFALAIPKAPGQTHWAMKPADWDTNPATAGKPYWGEQIWMVGHQAFPQAAQAADFSWKVVDGDSQQPGKLFKGKPGKKPCENEGWPGHWVLKLSGGFAPKIYEEQNGSFVQIVEPGRVKCGYYAEVNLSVEGNNSQTSPGVYLNHSMVCFRAYGQEITFGPDVNAAGFGASPLPPGATMTPPASSIPMPQAQAVATPGMPPVPGVPAVAPMPTPGVGGSVPMPSAPVPVAAAPIPVAPNPQFVQMPPPGGAPAPAAMPPASVPQVPGVPMPAAPAPVAPPPVDAGPRMAPGCPYSYAQLQANGWTDAQMVQQGYLLP